MMKSAILFMIFLIGFTHAHNTDIWQKAVTLFAENEKWVPGNMEMDMQLLNKEGDVEHVSHFEYRMFLDENNLIGSELVRAFEGGQDVTEKLREEQNQKNADDQQKQEFGLSAKDSPFHPDNQEHLTLKEIGYETLDGFKCSKFEYTFQQKEGNQLGTAWLSREGFPVKLSYTVDPLPKGMKEMLTTCLYSVNAEKRLELTHMELAGTAGFLFIKKSFAGTFTFTDYWLQP